MSKALFLLGVTLAVTGQAIEKADVSPEEVARRKALVASVMMKHAGGFVRNTSGQRGRILFVNAQSRLNADVIRTDADYIATALKIRLDVVTGEPVTVQTATATVGKLQAEGVVFIVDDPQSDVPMLAAPEKRWVICNVAPLMEKDLKPEKFEARARKMLGRSFGMVTGAFNGNRPLSILGPVFKPSHLDWISDLYLPSEVIQRIPPYMRDMGVTSYSVSTYQQACQEGWAPQPTNEYQKAIWEKVHTPPSKPLKITYDKDREKPVVK